MLSVAIITFNEELNLARTLRSVIDIADEVVIVDSGSTDRTLEIAREFGPKVKIYSEPWKGFAAQKNSAIDKCTHDFILSLDADEEISPLLAQSIDTVIHEKPSAAYRIPRRNMFLGRWMKHGGYYPDPKVRLFARGVARFEDRPVHEDLVLSPPCKASDVIWGDIIHHAYPTLSGYIEHMNRYSSLGAEMAVTRGKAPKSYVGLLANCVYRPYFTFVYNYFLRGGFLDGKEGLLQHLYHAAYVSWKYAKAWEQQRGVQS